MIFSIWVFSNFGSYHLAVVGNTNLRLKLLRFRAQRTNFPRARVDGKHNITSTRPKTLPGIDGDNVPGISYLKPRKKVFGSQAGVTSHLLEGVTTTGRRRRAQIIAIANFSLPDDALTTRSLNSHYQTSSEKILSTGGREGPLSNSQRNSLVTSGLRGELR